MVRDAALRSAFMSPFAYLYGMVRVSVRPDCHQNSHQTHLDEVGYRGGRDRWLRAARRTMIFKVGHEARISLHLDTVHHL